MSKTHTHSTSPRVTFLLVFLLLFSLLTLGACGPTPPSDVNYHHGSEGIDIQFSSGFPERTAYEDDPLPVVLELENRGAYDVPFDRVAVTFGFDPLYIDGPTEYHFPQADEEDAPPFYGKSVYYPDGSFELLDFYEFKTRALQGLRQVPQTRLTAQVCYEYVTSFAEEVCVDVDRFLRSGREQACTGEDLTASSQGAPVAVKKVQVRSDVVSTGGGAPFVRPEFVVHISNVGQGAVIAPPQADFVSACRIQGLSAKELNSVRINASILGLNLECVPELVRLRDGEGTTRCKVADEDVGNPALVIQQNFYSPLSIHLSYLYRQTTGQTITVERAPGYDIDPDAYANSTQNPISGVYYENGEARGTLCQHYVENPGEFDDKVGPGFDCVCSAGACREMDQDGFCYYGLCPGDAECCNKAAYDDFKKGSETESESESESES